MEKQSCLTYVLDKLHTEGGLGIVRKSSHREVGHVMHQDNNSNLTHYVPPKDLRHPWTSMFGFEGEIRYEDSAPTPPMTRAGLWWSAVILLIVVTGWALRGKLRDMLKRKATP